MRDDLEADPAVVKEGGGGCEQTMFHAYRGTQQALAE